MIMSSRSFAAIALAVGLTSIADTALANRTANTALQMWIDAVASGDVSKVGDILAPEFQIVRGSGLRYDATNYLEVGLPTVNSFAPKMTDVKATETKGLLIVSYWLEIEVQARGRKLTRRAPRLTVFREVNGKWLVSAHSNFAVPAD